MISYKIIEAIGWTWSQACNLLDSNIDPRNYEIPQLLDDYHRDFDKIENDNQEIQTDSPTDCF